CVGPPGSPAKLIPTPQIPNAYVVYEWRVPASRDLQFTARKLALHWRLPSEPTQESLMLRVYDWGIGLGGSYKDCNLNTGTGAYIVKKSSDWTERVPQRAAGHVDREGGLIRFRLDATQETFIESVSLDVEGERDEPAQRR
ncbi:hypothetical protein HY251_11190, partial [bacterium]|nr:hypothetical protein [bacterium]